MNGVTYTCLVLLKLLIKLPNKGAFLKYSLPLGLRQLVHEVLQLIQLVADLVHRQVVLKRILFLLDFPLYTGHIPAEPSCHILNIPCNITQFQHLGQ